jgi:hypothetical protein
MRPTILFRFYIIQKQLNIAVIVTDQNIVKTSKILRLTNVLKARNYKKILTYISRNTTEKPVGYSINGSCPARPVITGLGGARDFIPKTELKPPIYRDHTGKQ